MIQKNDSELVLGLITTVGTDIDAALKCIVDHLQKFGYTSQIISVSKDIMTKFNCRKQFENEADRIEYYMNFGNYLREKTTDSSILMKAVSAHIFENRFTGQEPQPKGRVAYIIKSIKHPGEIDFLRKTYGDGFHLVGFTSSYEMRIDYLTQQKNTPRDRAISLLERDSSEEIGHGQHTQDAFQQADYFINIGNEADKVRSSVAKMLDLLFGDPFISPCFDEYAMFMAYATSLRSADLSRQVGAVIANNNEIIAAGVNDCPKAQGGLYWPVLKENGKYEDCKDGRDYKLGFDSNKKQQLLIIDKILESFDIDITEENRKKIADTGIGSLTEFGRVVHAEMEALLMCARNNISCKNSTMYVTTFPCHNCAKHIIAAGISKVIYIEPYPKSKTFDFYAEETSENLEEKNKVIFAPFTGVGPQKFIDLFALKSIKSYTKTRKNKSNGKVIPWERGEASLRNPMPLIIYLDREKAAYKAISEMSIFLGGDQKNEEFGMPKENIKWKTRIDKTFRNILASKKRN